jgi:polyhydroxyalkanoic acid synthase PhaR subunit
MSSSDSAPSNPFEVWKQIYEANERAWNSALERAMSTTTFAEAQGRFLESMLAAQKAVRDNTRSFMEAMNLPTREDIARLGELIVALEEKVDQLDDRLMRIEQQVQQTGTNTASKSAKGSARR